MNIVIYNYIPFNPKLIPLFNLNHYLLSLLLLLLQREFDLTLIMLYGLKIICGSSKSAN